MEGGEMKIKFDYLDEALVILTEECGELTQAASKIIRHGINNHHPVTKIANRDALTQEVGDVLVLIDWLVDHDIIRSNWIEGAKLRKIESLKEHSTLYVDRE